LKALRFPLALPFAFMAICFSLVLTTILQDFWTASVGLLVLAMAFAVYWLFIWERALPRFGTYRRLMALSNGGNKFIHFKLKLIISTIFYTEYFVRITQIALNCHQIDISEGHNGGGGGEEEDDYGDLNHSSYSNSNLSKME
jgi:hypothetical protein